MKNILLLTIIALIALLTGCNQGASSEDVAQVAYDWEKATLMADYEREQDLLYEKGTYEIHKESPARKSSIKFEDMKIEVYYDKENEWYYSLISYTNPDEGNKVEDSYVVREKDEELKIDIEESKNIDESEIKDSFVREDCVNCE
ncbi:hypothetical protein [Metabacillus litoralis]|uniref:hypothetical protein n=1 Tax=Metabacillus litoralis TaxID=152268 RepID=UPI00203D7901|nr:hypothetical protein [Metabacillus litoralis]MCM3413224.1 hypothetical protein [Metabacillus litoralis]